MYYCDKGYKVKKESYNIFILLNVIANSNIT